MTSPAPASRPRWLGRRVLVSAAGVLIAVGVPVGWSLTDHPTGVRQVNPGTVTRLAGADPAPAADPASSIPISPPGGQTLPATPTLASPVRITVNSLSINAPVAAQGVEANGEMAIPTDVRTVGWYQWSSAPGAHSGSVVLVGHVDSAVQGRGAFFRLRTLEQGALVSVTTADRKVWTYRVIAREEFPKTAVPLDAIFAQTGPERLVLATCGGVFNSVTRSYEDNIVITASPLAVDGYPTK